jgi:hypothetical protein
VNPLAFMIKIDGEYRSWLFLGGPVPYWLGVTVGLMSSSSGGFDGFDGFDGLERLIPALSIRGSS